MSVRCIILGAGGHGRVVLETISTSGSAVVAGFLDGAGASVVGGLPVLGGDEMLPDLVASGISHFVVGVGSSSDTSRRASLFESAKEAGLTPLTVAHPTAVISTSASIGEGSFLGSLSVVNAGAQIGDNVIVNTAAVVEHDCRIGDHVHVASGACLAGGVLVGDRAHVGAAATVKQGVRVGEGAVVAIGSAVIRDIEPYLRVGGVPATDIDQRDE